MHGDGVGNFQAREMRVKNNPTIRKENFKSSQNRIRILISNINPFPGERKLSLMQTFFENKGKNI
jgi:hypothetical protein